MTIYDHKAKHTKMAIYIGELKQKFIYVLLVNSHYYVIRTPSSFFKSNSFCHYCKSSFNNLKTHKCPFICKLCIRKDYVVTGSFDCKKKCANELCLSIHTSKFCMINKKCNECLKYYLFRHVCDDDKKWCNNCARSVPYDHHCFISRETIKENAKFKGFIFFDYEASQENSKHVANLVIAHKYNMHGALTGKEYFYNNGNDVNNNFCSWLFDQEHYIAIAHNLKGYDGIFLMNFIINSPFSERNQTEIINQGAKIMSLTHKNVHVIDSFCFLPMSLAAFSSTFNITEVKKGYFPHFFNTLDNQNYIGTYPEAQFYGEKYMIEEKRKTFFEWYNKVKDSVFDFQRELFDYCESDVDLLAKGCLAFRRIII